MATAIRKFKETIDFRSLWFKRLRSHRYFPFGVVIAALLLLACVHIWQRVHVIKLVGEVGELRNTNRILVDNARKTQNEIATLSIGTRIETYARDTLGMRTIPGDRLFTLVRKRDKDVPRDELATILSSIGRVAEYLPVVTETKAKAVELEPIKFDAMDRKDKGE